MSITTPDFLEPLVRCYPTRGTIADDDAHSGMRLEIVGLDGTTAYVSAEEVGRTVGSLRRWVSAQADLPSPSLLRLKSGCRDLLL